MPILNLHHLHVFSTVAATGGIRRSADLLYRASSAVGRSVAALEKHLEIQLFERKGNGMLLTAAGETVRLRTHIIEAELRDVRDDAVRFAAREGGFVGSMEALFNERRLQSAVLLADVHHMPSVARVMGMSQSAISQAITKLEDALGQTLFRRTAQGMMPTDAGTRWILRFNRALVELDHIVSDIAALKGVLEGVITVGALPLARTLVLPTAITSILKKYPQLRVRSLESTYEELTAGLLSGRIDFIIGALRTPTENGLQASTLLQDQTAVIARADHPLASKPVLSFDDLQQYAWVLSRAGTPLRVSLEQFFQDHGRKPPQPAAETGDLALLRGLLVSSDMITVLSAHQLHYEITTGQLTVLRFPMDGLNRQIGVTTRAGAYLSPGATALLAELQSVAETWQ
ncbi:LysR family transcriptional regulator [Glaciimonas sp. Gout2]|uniref:LysR family transcriptional regulator n=1 Tax=Oxalobacteraceae TaxID=75682 RepID=UPI002AB41B47|nr:MULTISPECIES: LysR family transcriptional regulator [Oxalobacteraceae]MDY7578833.1 LysR family transcriptional regulator [Herbaspirillum sp. RTI4]MEA9982687.1 LysR family transcriptional regulator [Herbaspirillum sp. RTI4]MEB0013077.1 LysR family transcriptional regulator [Glaciimonas sp. Cout2]MEB0082040.1 LysR family transcriptional regulator [Glaciimonas sp. Gout2]